MNKLKMLALGALAAAMIGSGALATAPSASALPALPPHPRGDNCDKDYDNMMIYARAMHALWVLGYGGTQAYNELRAKYLDAKGSYNWCRSPEPDPLL
jgi:hypothetical protein